jgi:hypothetical protein
MRHVANPPSAAQWTPSSREAPYPGLPPSLLVSLADLLSYFAMARPDHPRFSRKSVYSIPPELIRDVDCSCLNAPDELRARGIQFARWSHGRIDKEMTPYYEYSFL